MGTPHIPNDEAYRNALANGEDPDTAVDLCGFFGQSGCEAVIADREARSEKRG
jgi:hypothetical protein